MLTDRPFGSLIREEKPTKDLWGILDRHAKPITFDAIRIKLAAPQKIRDWSHGEVKKPETINYRTFKPERDGLFCARIFGPTKDYECACGKYKRMKFAGVVCDKCGVEVTRARVRRERMGHIELASPVSHVWFFKGLPSRIGQLLDMSLRELEKILYFEEHVALESKIPAIKKKDLVSVDKARKTIDEHGPDSLKVGMGAEAIRELLRDLDLDALARDLRAQMLGETSVQKRKKIVKRLKVIEAFLKSGNQPDWLILEVVPVIPPELRPLVPLDGGRFPSWDLYDPHRRLFERNQRLKRLWDILEDVIKEHPVLLNRAPTLHRLGIQAFEPILVEGKAIEIHPLVCTAFNADFDGDQMAVHVPLSMEAQLEAQVLMLSSNNILSPANGAPLAVPTQDMVLGIYYLTKERLGTPERPVRGEGRLFPDPEEVRIAYDNEDVDLQARIRLRWSGEVLETTVGRTLFNGVVPEPLRFVNQELKKKEITALVGRCYNLLGNEVTVAFLDELKDVGFRYATLSGLSIGIDDMHIPSSKERHIASAREQVNEVEQQYQDGVITNGERYNKVVDIWAHTTELISEEMFRELESGEQGGEFNPIYMMADSGARGSRQQIRQLAGMRGLMAKPSGEIIETPITSNFREGLTVLEYFTSTHGARKGLADTALKTADSGYLTRRLVDVSQDVIVSEYDCGTVKYIEATPLVEGGDIIQSLRDRILGRVAAEDIRDPLSGEIIVQVNTEITEELAQKIEDSGLERVRIRSTLTCDTKRGICVMCYGRKIKVKADQRIKARTVLVEWDPFTNPILTEFTGRVEYQEILEGVTVREEFDEVTGLARKVVIEDPEGKLQPGMIIRSADAENPSGERHRYPLPVGANLAVTDGTEVFAADIIAKIPRETTKTKDITGGLPRVAELFEARKPKEQAVITEIDGRVEMGGFVKGMRKILIRADNGETREYLIPRGKHISVHEGDRVRAGEPLMDGSPNPHDYLAVLGDRELQRYLVNEVQEVYRLQGVTINDKHIEIIVRQMLRRVRIEEVGDTEFVVGELVDKFVFQEENDRVLAQGKRAATAKTVLLGITKASLSTDSFISAASFQETTRVLTEAAISGKTDDLRGLKENVIVGRLIPAGTGLGNYTRVEVLTPAGEAMKTLDSVLQLTPPPAEPAEGEGDGSVAVAG